VIGYHLITNHNRISHNDLKALYMGAFTIIKFLRKFEFRLECYRMYLILTPTTNLPELLLLQMLPSKQIAP